MQDASDAEARLFNHTDVLLQGHRRLLSDAERNRSFYQALSEAVTDGSTVLDIGSGTGVWAVAAAMLGARRVVAVEYEPLLTGVIRALAEEHGVADRIEIVSGDSRRIELAREFDIVVSETVGHLVFDESIVPIMIDARERFLKPGGRLIPNAVRLKVSAARLENSDERLPAGIPLSGSVLDRLAKNVPLAIQDRSTLTLISEPRLLVEADLRMVSGMPDLVEMKASWELPDVNSVNCFAVWAEADLTANVSVSAYRTTSWMPMIYQVEPFKAARGEVEFSLTLTEKTSSWRVTARDGSGLEEKSYSPAIAATEMLTRSRPYSKVLEQLSVLPG